MKVKQFATVFLAALLLLMVFGSQTVLAPPPASSNPPVLWDVIIKNSSENPVPVTIANEDLEVVIDDPIEVTNPEGESLNVSIPDGVEVTNLDEINLDVSGWLHTTQRGRLLFEDFSLETENHGFYSIVTTGYREVTVMFSSTSNYVYFEISWQTNTPGYSRVFETWNFGDELAEHSVLDSDGNNMGLRYFLKTYPVHGDILTIKWSAEAGVLGSTSFIDMTYYMTT